MSVEEEEVGVVLMLGKDRVSTGGSVSKTCSSWLSSALRSKESELRNRRVLWLWLEVMSLKVVKFFRKKTVFFFAIVVAR